MLWLFLDTAWLRLTDLDIQGVAWTPLYLWHQPTAASGAEIMESGRALRTARRNYVGFNGHNPATGGAWKRL